MGIALFTPYKEAMLNSGIASLDTGAVRAGLIDMDTETPAAITDATNATPIVVTAAAHGLSNGDRVAIQGVAGNTAANGVFTVASVATNTFELTDRDGANVAGSGAYTSGGTIMNLEQDFRDDLAGVVAVSADLTTTTIADGVFDADDVTFSAVTGASVEGIFLYENIGADTTDRLIMFAGSDTVTGLPITPSGADIQINWPSTIGRIFRLITEA